MVAPSRSRHQRRPSTGVIALLASSAFLVTPPVQSDPAQGPGSSTGWPPSQSGSLGIGLQAPAISLKDTQGTAVTMSQFAGSPIVLIWIDPQCPTCIDLMQNGSIASTMTQAKQADSRTVFLFINSNRTLANSATLTADFLALHGVKATALIDGNGTAAKAYAAMTTPHCFVIDTKGVISYAGALDDKAGTNHVVNAVKALKEGRPVSPANTRPYGTAIASP